MEEKQIREELQYYFEEELLEEIIRKGIHKRFSNEEELISIGQPIRHFPIVIAGSLKVLTEDPEQGELLLYYLELGDTCAMTLQCCFGNTTSRIRVEAEGPTEVILLPVQLMEQWIVKYQKWRRFIFNSYYERLREMLEAINGLAFDNLESRLEKYLKDKALVKGSQELKMTQHQIAAELNTSRVVISRLIRKLESQGKVAISRGTITVLELRS